MLMPKRVKRRRVHRGRMTGKAQKGNTVTYGEYGLVALEPSWITSNQIEAARIAMTRYIKRGGKVWICNGEVLPTKNGVNPREERRNDRRDNKRNDRRDNRRNNRRGNDNRGNNRGQRPQGSRPQRTENKGN